MGYSNPCRGCKHEDDRMVDEPCRSCESGNNYTRSPMTNADRIRAMSDEELATAMCQNNTTCDGCPVVESCHGEHGLPELVVWLRQEVEQ